jgi:alanyl-tRNA synthetase
MGSPYPELVADFDRINRMPSPRRPEAFPAPWQSGSKLFEEAAAATKSSGTTVLTGSDAFALHDTYDFPSSSLSRWPPRRV